MIRLLFALVTLFRVAWGLACLTALLLVGWAIVCLVLAIGGITV